MEGNLCFKIDWARLKVGSKFTIFALFYFVFKGNFPSTSPQGAYIWRGLFRNFTVFKPQLKSTSAQQSNCFLITLPL